MGTLGIRQLGKLYVSLRLLLLRFSRHLLSPSISILFARSTVVHHRHRALDLRVLPLATLTVSQRENVSIIRPSAPRDPPPKMSLMAVQQRTVLSACGHAPAAICCAGM